MMYKMAIPEPIWEQMLEWLSTDIETAGVLRARVGMGRNTTQILVRDLTPVPTSSYVERAADHLSIASSGYVPALAQAEADGAAAVFVHTHPSGSAHYSSLDDIVDRQLCTLFQTRTRQPVFVSLILAGTPELPSYTARVYVGRAKPKVLDCVRVVGRHLRVLTSTTPTRTPERRFDRQVRAFGTDGQALLAQLHVGVIGAGATGSAVFEQLIRLGVGRVTIVDDDTVEDTNVTRVHEVTSRDIGKSKVEVLAHRARAIGTGSQVSPLSMRIRDEDTVRPLVDCDMIFGCTDDVFGRAILSRFAYWYLTPVFDMGFVIDSQAGQVRGLYGRVTMLGPGCPCLLCRGRISPAAIYQEGLDPTERQARVAQGYAPELAEPAPAVVPYTTLIASLAVAEALDRLFYLSVDPPSEVLVRLTDRVMNRTMVEPQRGHFCIDSSFWGLGDQAPTLGQTWPG